MKNEKVNQLKKEIKEKVGKIQIKIIPRCYYCGECHSQEEDCKNHTQEIGSLK